MMKRCLIVIAGILLAGNIGFGFISEYLDIEEGSLQYKLVTEPDSMLLMTAALVASGTDEASIGTYIEQLYNIDTDIKYSVSFTNQTDTASEIFDYMHSMILDTYKEDKTLFTDPLNSGKFNCMSSTVLYNSLLELNGIEANAVIIPSHVYTMLNLNGGEIDVENTTLYGFDVRNNEQAQKNLERLTGFDYTPSSEAAEIVGKKGLIAYLFSNRTFYAMKKDDYYDAFQYSMMAYAIFPESEVVITNAVSSYLYYGIDLADDGEYTEALALLEEAMLNMPDKSEYTNNYIAILGNYLLEYIEDGYYDESIDLIDEGIALTGNKMVDLMEHSYFEIIYQLLNREKNYTEAYEYAVRILEDYPNSVNIKKALVNGMVELYEQLTTDWSSYPENEDFILQWYALMDDDDFDNTLMNYYNDLGLSYYHSGDLEKGVELIDKGLSYFPDSDLLKNNGVYMVGNTAVAYLNEGDYETAIEYLLQALEYDPDDATMNYNLEVAYVNMVSEYVNAKDWEKVYSVSEEGLELVPESENLLYYKDYAGRQLN